MKGGKANFDFASHLSRPCKSRISTRPFRRGNLEPLLGLFGLPRIWNKGLFGTVAVLEPGLLDQPSKFSEMENDLLAARQPVFSWAHVIL